MATLHNLKPEKVIKTFEKTGWVDKGQRGSHVKLVKPGNPNILSIPVHSDEQLERQEFVDNQIYDL